ncbi:hypothetical protein QR66_03240 [Chromobacterium piscinae]|nr:hypothetical protein QR66_03240 [Chromobacterium piscinae]
MPCFYHTFRMDRCLAWLQLMDFPPIHICFLFWTNKISRSRLKNRKNNIVHIPPRKTLRLNYKAL